MIKNKSLPIPSPSIQQVSTLIDKEISPWANLINNNTDELKNIYLPNAVKINNKAEVISGNTLINTYYKKNPVHIDSIRVLTRVDASPVKVYEMGKIYTRGHKTYIYLHIWDTGDQHKKIELEFIEESRSSSPVTNEINKAREEWMRLCNQHDASKLIDKMYTENALYYNHKPMVVGRNAITREYSYMNNGNYHLKLDPIHSEMVNEKMVFEIGQCSGSYGGKYMIVWQKTASGVWQVLMDSNI
jgi:ketosteroid isomerase-like protein